MIDALRAPVAMLDRAGRVIRVNSAWRELSDRPGQAPIRCGPGDSYVDACAAASEVRGAAALRSGLRWVLTGRKRTFERDCRLVREGVWRDYRVRISRLDHQEEGCFLVEQEEITALTQAEEMNREMGEHLLEAQAEERQRLAVELHDSVGQNLVSVGLGLSHLRIVAPQTSAVESIITDMASSLQEAHAQIRSLSYLLNPPWPEHEETLENAVREFAQGFGRRAGLSVRVRLEGGYREIDQARELTLFRILQEGLVNVYRHAHANAVIVELINQPHAVTLRVTDDGRGFPNPEGAASPLGVGISGMRARARQFGGDLTIASGPTGTTLTVKLPRGVRDAESGSLRRVEREERSWRAADAGPRRG